ncbi:MAG: hypothetical protein IPJ74_23905 [Saprospiraceae bacterium]|nr:hypothetical protein [Saprospiraceae bacterium]
MLKFFRNIRRRLLDSGSLRKYFVYAIGEIILVVIGILIALQINNWNENRKDRAKELKILINLQQDFRYTQKALETSLQSYPIEIGRLRSALGYIGMDASELTSEMKDTIYHTNYRPTAIVEGTLNSILNTDKLELISNDSLKYLLTAYPAEVNKFKSQQDNVKRIVLEIQRPVLESFITLAEFRDMEGIPDLKNKVIPSDFENLLKSRDYQNALMDRLNQNDFLVTIAERTLVKTSAILEIIEREIEKKK